MSDDKSNKRLLDMLQSKYPNYHPVVAMAEMAHESGIEDAIRLSCHKEVARYIEPQLKQVEHRGSVKQDHGVLRVVQAAPAQLVDDQVDQNGTSITSQAAQLHKLTG